MRLEMSDRGALAGWGSDFLSDSLLDDLARGLVE
jgi:hypothetical protein